MNDDELYNMDNLAELIELFHVTKENRDQVWQDDFTRVLPSACLASYENQVSEGPDGHPYFRLRIPDDYEAFSQFSLLSVLDTVCEHGFGLVIHDPQGEVLWVFSYGDLWNFRSTNRFFNDPLTKESRPAEQSRDILVSQPNENFLPLDVRRVLCEVAFTDYGMTNLSACTVFDPSRGSLPNLVFNIFPEVLGEEGVRKFVHDLSWLLPRNMPVAVVGECSSLVENMEPLLPQEQLLRGKGLPN